MPGASTLRLFGSLAGLLALVTLAWLVRDRFEQKYVADAARSCAVAAPTPAAPLETCLPAVRDRIETARRAAACDGALADTVTAQTRFAIRQSCGGGVKRLVASLEAARTDAASMAAQLAEVRADTVTALARAEARSARNQERDTHARAVIAAQPRRGDGGIACDVECLRQLGR